MIGILENNLRNFYWVEYCVMVEFYICLWCVFRCVGSGYILRWYYTSVVEYYCNECFEYYYRWLVFILN